MVTSSRSSVKRASDISIIMDDSPVDSMMSSIASSSASSSASANSSSSSLSSTARASKNANRTAECIRNVANFSKVKPIHMMDRKVFSPEMLSRTYPSASPKMDALFKKILALDAKDMKKDGVHYKHMIFTDMKSSTYGLKLLASGFAANGYVPAFAVHGTGFGMKAEDELKETKGSNFGVLSSKTFFDRSMSTRFKKAQLDMFCSRPDNIHGELIRFIILDQGFKEGIDLFDIKYVHLFEPLLVRADEKQAIGRGTRFCGQKGLKFHPRFGWPLYVFRYDVDSENSGYDAKTLGALYFEYSNIDLRKVIFAAELESASIEAAVDHALTAPVHQFKIETPPPAMHGGVTSSTCITSSKHKPPSRMMNYGTMSAYIRKNFMDFKYPEVKLQNNCLHGGASNIVSFTPSQDFVRHFFQPSSAYKGMLLFHSVGTGKCHAKDTPILMYDGSIKMVQDVNIGDLLMGDDSTPRKVLSLAQDKDEMYDIVPTKGDKYTVNSEHILCLRPTRLGVKHIKQQTNLPYCAQYINIDTGKVQAKSFVTQKEANAFLDGIHSHNNVLEITVKDYLQLSKSSQKNLKGYRVGIEFPEKPIDFDPYIIGYWLGDGSKREPVISTADHEVIDYFNMILPHYNLQLNHQSKYDYRISGIVENQIRFKSGTNAMLNVLRSNNLINNKHIPSLYKCNSRKVRLELLAGLIDSDGHADQCKNYDIIQKSKTLAYDIVYLCRSLGFAAYMKECKKSCTYKGEKKEGNYYRICISGNGLDQVPVKIPRKKLMPREINKDALVTGITVKHIGRGKYYGFTLDGNNRYLLGDFTVTHNTCTAIATATTSFEQKGYNIMWVTRHTLKNDIWKNMYSQVCSLVIQDQLKKKKLKLPERISGPMKYVSDKWIEPMSYKQFSNMLLKKNKFYAEVVRRNGEIDPLRKTLIIIDEAHKLYSPGVAASEKPKVEILEQMIQKSYKVSGDDSCRVLLMTATPYTEDGMEMINLLNLLRPAKDAMPTDFDDFSKEYLDASGSFTKNGLHKFYNDVSGYISYLNRSQDARNFSHPVVEDVHVPMSMQSDMEIKPPRQLDLQVAEIRGNLKDERMKMKEIAAVLKNKKKDAKALVKELIAECKEEANEAYTEGMEEAKENKVDALEKCKERPRKERKACKEEATSEFREETAALKEQKKQALEDCKEDNNIESYIGEKQTEFNETKQKVATMNEARKEITSRIKETMGEAKDKTGKIKELSGQIQEARLERKTQKGLIDKNARKLRKLTKSKNKDKKQEIDEVKKQLMTMKAKYREITNKYNELRTKKTILDTEKKLLRLSIGRATIGDVSQETALEKKCKL